MMLFRSSTIRSLTILLAVNILVYIIFLRWISPVSQSNSKTEKQIINVPSIPTEKERLSAPPIFQHAPMHDELVQLHFRPVR